MKPQMEAEEGKSGAHCSAEHGGFEGTELQALPVHLQTIGQG